ncbi:MAG: hypothetical protein JW712_00775 [Dehalococcoidales bacterium]|nr:hypothetical protein [Dehalococcoidales bacterium]
MSLESSDIEYLDKVYEDGYLRIPEEPELGEAQLEMISEILDEESW